MKNLITAINLGRLSYQEALKTQHRHARKILDCLEPRSTKSHENILFLVEHPPVYTIGLRTDRYGKDERDRLRGLGAEFYETNRGGLITFHGPGQLVAYPVLYMKDFKFLKLNMRCYIHSLEQSIIRLCDHFGIQAETSPDTGVWVGDKKIAAIGVHGSRYVVTHGLALNCNTDLRWFDHIVPCGIENKGVTSLSQEKGHNVTIEDAIKPFLDCFAEEFKCDVELGNNHLS